MRSHICCHTDCNARTAVDEKIGVGSGEYEGFENLPVVVGSKINCVFIGLGHHRHCRKGEAGLGVTHCRRARIKGPEVSMAINEGKTHRKRLSHAHQGVIDRNVAVGMELTHDFTDDS